MSTTERDVFNFGAGPAMLPAAVMRQAQQELLDWRGTGISVIEMSHRSTHFAGIVEESESDLRELLNIPDSHRILFLQGGASSQFAMVPMNLLREQQSADYIHTGIWSGKAIKEAKKIGLANVAASSEAENFLTIPPQATWSLSEEPSYVYYTDNETIGGLEFSDAPDVGSVPLVSDMTSNFLSRPVDFSKYAVVFAGSQKNIGPAGLVIVIVREDLLGNAGDNIPSLYDYAIQSKENSLYNTPPTFTWYMAGLVFKWVKSQGGIAAMQANSESKSGRLYDYIDQSQFYANPVEPEFRSRMNVPFTLANDELNDSFLNLANDAGMVELKGHRSVGGMRASLYNAMPEDGVNCLLDFMREFEKQHA
ncbi:MAG: 3-phosphoserine/phosphohydroxythreonine transaminase [Gammaproteobacteria bacterium]|nr:3-phosphoserine/phosphohydroxythreonine transaminase [Gammaproteobacteria bacterium]